ncbi:MAG: hypothetical protein OSB57_15225, partial [Planctomycetota bacterium]|nr:hypothetical protein [Planctomycetota bacterium]
MEVSLATTVTTAKGTSLISFCATSSVKTVCPHGASSTVVAPMEGARPEPELIEDQCLLGVGGEALRRSDEAGVQGEVAA